MRVVVVDINFLSPLQYQTGPDVLPDSLLVPRPLLKIVLQFLFDSNLENLLATVRGVRIILNICRAKKTQF